MGQPLGGQLEHQPAMVEPVIVDRRRAGRPCAFPSTRAPIASKPIASPSPMLPVQRPTSTVTGPRWRLPGARQHLLDPLPRDPGLAAARPAGHGPGRNAADRRTSRGWRGRRSVLPPLGRVGEVDQDRLARPRLGHNGVEGGDCRAVAERIVEADAQAASPSRSTLTGGRSCAAASA